MAAPNAEDCTLCGKPGSFEDSGLLEVDVEASSNYSNAHDKFAFLLESLGVSYESVTSSLFADGNAHLIRDCRLYFCDSCNQWITFGLDLKKNLVRVKNKILGARFQQPKNASDFDSVKTDARGLATDNDEVKRFCTIIRKFVRQCFSTCTVAVVDVNPRNVLKLEREKTKERNKKKPTLKKSKSSREVSIQSSVALPGQNDDARSMGSATTVCSDEVKESLDVELASSQGCYPSNSHEQACAKSPVIILDVSEVVVEDGAENSSKKNQMCNSHTTVSENKVPTKAGGKQGQLKRKLSSEPVIPLKKLKIQTDALLRLGTATNRSILLNSCSTIKASKSPESQKIGRLPYIHEIRRYIRAMYKCTTCHWAFESAVSRDLHVREFHEVRKERLFFECEHCHMRINEYDWTWRQKESQRCKAMMDNGEFVLISSYAHLVDVHLQKCNQNGSVSSTVLPLTEENSLKKKSSSYSVESVPQDNPVRKKENKLYPCLVCSKHYRRAEHLRAHLQDEHGINSHCDNHYFCLYCSKPFVSTRTDSYTGEVSSSSDDAVKLKYFAESHSTCKLVKQVPAMHLCKFCPKSFTCIKTLIGHENWMHRLKGKSKKKL